MHAFGGSDYWWNLDPKLIAPHKEKSRVDTSIVAKVRRTRPEWDKFVANMARPDKGQPRNRERKKKMIGQCPHCHFRVRSFDSRYISFRMLRHTMEKHPSNESR